MEDHSRDTEALELALLERVEEGVAVEPTLLDLAIVRGLGQEADVLDLLASFDLIGVD